VREVDIDTDEPGICYKIFFAPPETRVTPRIRGSLSALSDAVTEEPKISL
jgi:hypothetical protein